MTNIVDFPKLEKIPEALPRQRVFYVGYRYVGPMLCQDIQDLYLKRKGVTYEGRWWAMITYAPLDDYSSKLYSLELDECHEDLVPEMLEVYGLQNEVNISDLRKMGWRGRVLEPAPVVQLYTEQGDLFAG